MHKTRKPLYTWIPTWLVDRLQGRVPANGSLVFRCGVTQNNEAALRYLAKQKTE